MTRLSVLGLSALAMFGACSGANKNTKQGPLTPKDIVARSTPAIVVVEVSDGDERGTGTGFILDKGGLIATNFHVVKGKKDIKVKLYGGEVYPVSAIAGIDPARDLALLRIAPARTLPTLVLGDSDKMSAGDQVIAIGNPLGVFEYSVSSGLVSQVRPVCTPEQVALHKKNEARFEELAGKPNRTPAEDAELSDLQCSTELKILQISAPISQGSSGGPLFNQFGEVVGVTTAIITAGQNINLAIPANYLKPIVAQPGAISVDEFAQKTREASVVPGTREPDGVRIERKIPDHDLKVLDGCNREQIAELVKSIWEAIEVGAPLYNAGNHEACYRIYEGTATKYEQNAPCKGIKAAFGDGLLRAGTMGSYKEKAWAMRDAFDGLLKVSEKWAQAHPNGPNPTTPTPPKKK